MPHRVLLLNVPFGSIQWPSLALSNLKACLNAEGVACDVRYFTFGYARAMGHEQYTEIAENASAYSDLLGEWIFTSALFGPDAEARRRYLDEVVHDPSTARYMDPEAQRRAVDAAAKAYDDAPDFVEEWYRAVPWDDYSIVGFTTVFQQNIASLALARRVKERHPDVVVAFGGGNCEDVMGLELMRQFSFIDLVNNGEGELSFVQAVARLAGGGSMDDIPGIYSRAHVDRGPELPGAPGTWMQTVKDMDGLPFPDHSDFFEGHAAAFPDRDPKDLTMSFESSRGCWWGMRSHCTFCGLNDATMGYRSKSGERALQEVEYLHEAWGCREWQVVDDILDMRYFDSFLPALKEFNPGIRFFYETKANLKKDQVRLLVDAGVHHIQPGVESLSTDVLRLMRKGVTGLQNIQLLKWCRELGARPHWNILWGFPGETPEMYEDVAEVAPLLTHLTPPDWAGSFRLDRFSPMFVQPDAWDIHNVRVARPYQYVYPFDADAVRNIAYAFSHDVDQPVPVADYTRPLAEALDMWREVHGESALVFLTLEGGPVVVDTRPATPDMLIRLTAAQVAVLEFCDKIQGMNAVEKLLTERGEGDVDSVLTPIRERGLLLVIEDRALALPIHSRAVPSGARARIAEALALVEA